MKKPRVSSIHIWKTRQSEQMKNVTGLFKQILSGVLEGSIWQNWTIYKG